MCGTSLRNAGQYILTLNNINNNQNLLQNQSGNSYPKNRLCLNLNLETWRFQVHGCNDLSSCHRGLVLLNHEAQSENFMQFQNPLELSSIFAKEIHQAQNYF